MTLHKDLTGADLHEPKGIATATSGQVYQANGAGSGTWSSLVIPTGLFNITTSVFTSSGTWTKPTGMFMAKVTCIGGGGGNTGNGGTTSFGTYCSATGGISIATTTGVGGVGTIGDILLDGCSATALNPGTSDASWTVGNYTSSAGLRYGKYGCGGVYQNGSGAGGGAAIKYLYSTTGTVTVTVGAAGSGAPGTSSGQPGIVIIEQFIPV